MFAPFAVPVNQTIPSAPAPAGRAAPPVGTVLHFGQDQAIYGEGHDAELFYKVVAGVVRTCKYLADGRRQIDCFHTPGDVFGVEADGAYSFSAEAVSPCTVMTYRRRGFEASALTDADLSHRFFVHAMRSLARAQDHALLLGRRTALEKVAAFLVEWSEATPDGMMVLLTMTRQDIADYLGLTIETVSRTLSCLERDGLIAFASIRHIRLPDLAALKALNV